jgi:prepilin-type N-terminal cleavage/methylation domain-containing protein
VLEGLSRHDRLFVLLLNKMNAMPLRSGFSLLEMLVAMAVLSIMMVFLFGLTAQTIQGWERGSKQVEAAHAARVGLDYIARELQYAVSGPRIIAASATTTNTNVVPFFSATSAQSIPVGNKQSWRIAPDSGFVFAVAPLTSDSSRLAEVGFFSAHITNPAGYVEMPSDRFYLMMHRVRDVGANVGFYYKNVDPAPTNWITNSDFYPLIPNCYSLQLRYFSNAPAGLVEVPNWADTSKLPAGILATVKVMDNKTAARVRQLSPFDLKTNDPAVASVLQQGTVEISRFIPFLNSN